MEGKNSKFNQQEYAGQNKGSGYIKNYSQDMQLLKCLCGDDDGVGLTCFKCGSYTHRCIERKNNRNDQYQCASCISKALDPIYTVKSVLIETYFKTANIFEFYNVINLQFYVPPQGCKHNIQIRGLKPGSQLLCYPMIGDIYLNNERNPIFELKPLAFNSSRKVRKQDYLIIPKQRCPPGINYLRFKIQVMSKLRIQHRYQFQQTGVYYISVNLIEVIKSKDLILQTLRKRRISQKQSFALLTDNSNELQFQQTKLCLMCPYTGARIKVPVRGKYCRHVACICLETLITFHTGSRLWSCPVCQNRLNEPYVDMWIDSMLKDNNQRGEEVIIKRDGTYEWVGGKQIPFEEQDEINEPEPPEKGTQEILVPIDDDSDEVEIIQNNLEQIHSEESQVIIVDSIVQQRLPVFDKRIMDILKQNVDKVMKERDNNDIYPQDNNNNGFHTDNNNIYQHIPIKPINPVAEVEVYSIQESKNKQEIRPIIRKVSEVLIPNKETMRQPKRLQNKSKIIITDIPQVKYKQMSKQNFRKAHFTYQAGIDKQMNAFLKQNKELKQIFKQPYC